VLGTTTVGEAGIGASPLLTAQGMPGIGACTLDDFS